MKFVTGGCYQGKQQWVLTHEKLLQSQIADGAVCSAKEIRRKGAESFSFACTAVDAGG